MKDTMFSKNKILVTGINSGLGKFIYESIPGAIGLSRENRASILKSETKYDLIIHSAFNTKNAGKNEIDDNFKYIDDNVLLTNELSSLKHKKFVYISSIAVHGEKTPYSQTKLFAESIIQKKSNNPLIVRCSSLLGKTMRDNTITRIIKESRPKITLSKESTYNFISHEDVLDFIVKSHTREIKGIFDFVSSDYLLLGDIAEMINKNVSFGNYTFKTIEIDNKKLISTFPEFEKSSWKILDDFIKEIR